MARGCWGKKPKLTYSTYRDAKAAAQRRYELDRVRLKPYLCKYARPQSVHPLLRREHWHLTSRVAGADRPRWHEAWNDELGVRVIGCLIAENMRGDDQRRHEIVTRTQATVRRRAQAAEPHEVLDAER